MFISALAHSVLKLVPKHKRFPSNNANSLFRHPPSAEPLKCLPDLAKVFDWVTNLLKNMNQVMPMRFRKRCSPRS